MTSPWPLLPFHRHWLTEETAGLVAFSAAARHPEGGFAWLDVDGAPVLDRPVETWITTRMTHVLALGTLLGIPGCAPLVDHGLDALRGVLADPEHGGWFTASDRPNDGEKRAYELAFVVLASSSAAVTRAKGARGLLSDALDVVEQHFWDDERGVVIDVAWRDWSGREAYGGANANMHTVEAFLAAADVTGDRRWLDRALRIATFFIDRRARARDWRIPEHYDADWCELPDYNREQPAHPFRPYGATVGHGFEWSRLLLHLDAALRALDGRSPAWLVEASQGLFARAVHDGWRGDGFLYTTDWDGGPVVEDRLHWVVCEAIAAAAALRRHTGEDAFEQHYRAWWDLAAGAFIDRARGSWHAELDTSNRPAASVWAGKPDTYHAVQASLLPRLPLAPSLATAVAREFLDR